LYVSAFVGIISLQGEIIMYITPLEEAVLNAHEVAAGFAAVALIQNLIEKGEEAEAIVKNRDHSHAARKEALKEHKHINATLNLIAEQRSLTLGIEA
jgi:hypothetical protein